MLLTTVATQVGPESRAAERHALNRIHYCLNQLHLERYAEASRLAVDLYEQQLKNRYDILERVPREYFHKLIYYRLVLQSQAIASSERAS